MAVHQNSHGLLWISQFQHSSQLTYLASSLLVTKMAIQLAVREYHETRLLGKKKNGVLIRREDPAPSSRLSLIESRKRIGTTPALWLTWASVSGFQHPSTTFRVTQLLQDLQNRHIVRSTQHNTSRVTSFPFHVLHSSIPCFAVVDAEINWKACHKIELSSLSCINQHLLIGCLWNFGLQCYFGGLHDVDLSEAWSWTLGAKKSYNDVSASRDQISPSLHFISSPWKQKLKSTLGPNEPLKRIRYSKCSASTFNDSEVERLRLCPWERKWKKGQDHEPERIEVRVSQRGHKVDTINIGCHGAHSRLQLRQRSRSGLRGGFGLLHSMHIFGSSSSNYCHLPESLANELHPVVCPGRRTSGISKNVKT